MFKVVFVDWADNTTEQEFGLDIAGAITTAQEWSKFGKHDYVLVFQNGLPRLKFEDGEEAKL